MKRELKSGFLFHAAVLVNCNTPFVSREKKKKSTKIEFDLLQSRLVHIASFYLMLSGSLRQTVDQ